MSDYLDINVPEGKSFDHAIFEHEARDLVPSYDGCAFLGDTLRVFFKEGVTQDSASVIQVFNDHDGVEHDLAVLKRKRADEINVRTRELINEGFEFGGHRFSMSLHAQSRAKNAFDLRNSGMLTFPLSWSTLDDSFVIEIEDPDGMAAFYAAGIGAVHVVVGSGNQLKQAIAAADSVEAIMAIEDLR